MSITPFLFRNWWDDFDRIRPSRILDQHFGVGLNRDDLLSQFASLSPSLLGSSGYFRPWRDIAKQTGGVSDITDNEKQFQVILDVQQFAPNEITVKVSGNKIVVEGKHEERPDEHGFVSRHFVRKYLLPTDVEMENVLSNLSSDGILTISVPKKGAIPPGERIIPIQQTGMPAIKPAVESAKETAVKSDYPKETQIKVQQE